MRRIGVPKAGFIYDKLIEVAKLEEHWKSPKTVYEHLLKNGVITEAANPKDVMNTIRRQIMVLGELKAIFNRNKVRPSS